MKNRPMGITENTKTSIPAGELRWDMDVECGMWDAGCVVVDNANI